MAISLARRRLWPKIGDRGRAGQQILLLGCEENIVFQPQKRRRHAEDSPVAPAPLRPRIEPRLLVKVDALQTGSWELARGRGNLRPRQAAGANRWNHRPLPLILEFKF